MHYFKTLILTIALAPIFSFSQIELLKKNDIKLIGEINKGFSNGDHFSASLKRQPNDGKQQYVLMFVENGKRQNNKPCIAKFYATKDEIDLIYQTINSDFFNPEDANTLFKIGNSTLKSRDGKNIYFSIALNEQTSNIKTKKEKVLYLSLNKCTICIAQMDWQKLFGK